MGATALPPGTWLPGGRFRLDGLLGQGGFGLTYQGWHATLGHEVAIKELFLPGCRRDGTTVVPHDATAFARAFKAFLAEGRVQALLTVPGVMRVFDAFEANGTAYLVMERLRGETLEHRLARGPLPAPEVLELAIAIAQTLEGVHAAGLLHRDLKPGNLFLPADGGHPRLLDFGSAVPFAHGAESRPERLVTPGYAPLEQYAAVARFGPPLDLYGLAATLHHALVGVPPPAAPDRVQGQALRPLPAAVPPALGMVIMQALSPRVADRPATATAFLAPLLPVVRRPATARHVAYGLVAVLAFLAVFSVAGNQ